MVDEIRVVADVSEGRLGLTGAAFVGHATASIFDELDPELLAPHRGPCPRCGGRTYRDQGEAACFACGWRWQPGAARQRALAGDFRPLVPGSRRRGPSRGGVRI